MLIIDGHLDMAFNALFNRRDLTQPVNVLREREDAGRSTKSLFGEHLQFEQPGTATVSLPDMRKGQIGIIVSSIMARVQVPATLNAVRTQATTYGVGQGHLAYYRALERAREITCIKTVRDLEACVTAWENPTSKTPVGLILSMESADPIMGPDQVQEWKETGLRSVGLTHFGANTYGHGTGTVGGLYSPAYPLMDALRETEIAIDLTHASDLTFWQILDYWDGPVHASHCNCRALVPGQRHLTDDMILAITERGGVIGMVFAESFLNAQWNWEDTVTHTPTATRSMKAVVEHIDHICELVGNCDHVGFGTDLDGGFGRELAPTDYNSIADLQKFLEILAEHGYSPKEVAKIAHGNLLKFFQDAWSES